MLWKQNCLNFFFFILYTFYYLTMINHILTIKIIVYVEFYNLKLLKIAWNNIIKFNTLLICVNFFKIYLFCFYMMFSKIFCVSKYKLGLDFLKKYSINYIL